MAKKPVAEKKDADDESAEGEDEARAKPKKSGLAGRVLAPLSFLFRFLGFLGFLNPLRYLKLSRRMRMIAGAGLLLLASGAGGAFFFLSGPGEAETAAEAAAPTAAEVRMPAVNATFYPIPDIIVNIQTPDGTPAYLKLSVSLEVERPDAAAIIEPVLPRVVDQFQTYLRELRVEDIRGSAGVMRLKEELLRRVNLALAPLPVRDVLLREMIVQ